jgi:UDP-N-acetyl-2-amino-2-deoxyglucuronate dehydrogenase
MAFTGGNVSAQAGGKIRFAVIGASGVAGAHIRALGHNRKAQVVTLCSRDPGRARPLAAAYSLNVTDDYQSVIRDESIDAVDIVTEPGRHADLASAALKAGKHVLIEKPLDTDIGKAAELLKVYAAGNALAGVISQKRFDARLRNMKALVDKGGIGKPYFAQLRLFTPRTTEYYKRGTGWRDAHGNVLINQAIHWLDIALWFFGMPAGSKGSFFRFNKNIRTYDTAAVHLYFPGGLSLDLVCSTCVRQAEPASFTIYGPEGRLDYKDARSIASRLMALGTGSGSGLQDQIDDFIDAIIDKKQPAVTLQDGYNCLKVIHDCEQSGRGIENE